ncbi:MAG TPA: hypothetical protein VF247_03705 [Candidatus Krumholzibacteria bacterium]
MAPASDGMRVYLDPETGDMTAQPTDAAVAELDAALANTLRADDEGLTVEHHPDGSLSLDLQGRYGDVTMVRIGENGVQTICNNDADQILKNLNDKTSPTGLEVK